MPYIGNVTTDFDVSTANLNDQSVTAIKLSPDVGSNGQVLSVDGSGNLQWGNDANAPEGTAVLSTGESGTAKFLRVDGDGTCSWQVPPNTQLSFSNDANNRVVTGTGSGLNGEANLTFNGSGDLTVKGNDGTSANLYLIADLGEHDGDGWRIGSNQDDNDLTIASNTSGSYVDKITLLKTGEAKFHGIVDTSVLRRQVQNSSVIIAGGNATNDGANIALYGSTHSSQAGNFEFRSGSSDVLKIKSDGKVGIGTTSPSTELHVKGAGTVAQFEGTGGSSFIQFVDSDDGSIAFIGADGGDLKFQTPTGSYSDKLIIKNDGKVGIGTTSPSAPLHIVGSDNNTVLLVESTDEDASVGPIIELFRNSSSPEANDALGRIDFKGEDNAGNASTFARIAVTALDVANNSEDARLDFIAATNDTFTSTMSITGGNVGIATTSPGTKLDVAGDIRVKSSGVYKAGHNGSESAPLYTVNDADTGIFRGANANELAFATAANSRMLIDANGKVGIGTTAPTQALTVNAGSTDSAIAIFTGDDLNRGLKVSTRNL